KDSKMTKRF
ncbi:urocanase family protein, partial [Vibrio parahaemolyticus V-223/04]